MISAAQTLNITEIKYINNSSSIYKVSKKIPQFDSPIDFSFLDYSTVRSITKRRHTYSKRLPMFYFDSVFNIPEESENEVSDDLTYRSYAFIDDFNMDKKILIYLKEMAALADEIAQNFISKSFRNPYLAIARGEEISPHVHLYNDRIDSLINLSTISVCFNLKNTNAKFLIFDELKYENSKFFKDQFHNILTPVKHCKYKPLIEYEINEDITIFKMSSVTTLHAVSEFDRGLCLFYIYDKVQLL